ncbi:MAG: hypothetical protein QOG54_998 [Actinomycetota bacterium]|jgi:hypothetical protein|nr:hypothetical protein [Actinomycetota bacterium]
MKRPLAVALVAAVLAGLAAVSMPARAGDSCEWLAGDFHVHTVYSHDAFGGPIYDGDPTVEGGNGQEEAQEPYTLGWTPLEEGAIAQTRGLDFLAITDHNNMLARDTDPGYGGGDLIWVDGYENSLHAHAQMIGAKKIYEEGPANLEDIERIAAELRADGGFFQINHPADQRWVNSYGTSFIPDSIEAWNIGPWVYQPPFPASGDHQWPLDFYDGYLDRGKHIAATGGSDSHWRSTTSAQGAGQPTTWVCAESRSQSGIVSGVRAGRTTISSEPPNYGGAFATLETVDGRGLGSTVAPGTSVTAHVATAPGAILTLVTNGSEVVDQVTVDGPDFTHTFEVPLDSTWVRAEVHMPDGAEVRKELTPLCDRLAPLMEDTQIFQGEVSHCVNRLDVMALTSPIYFDPTTTVSYDGNTSGAAGGTATLSATLTGIEGEIEGAPLTFSFQDSTYAAVTDSNGYASVEVPVAGPAGEYVVTTTFGGSDTYDASADSDAFQVTE